MAIDTNKPLPMQVGNEYLFTLTNYEPVEVEVLVPFILDEDVVRATEDVLEDLNPSGEDITDKWIAENVDGVDSLEELHAAVRAELNQLNDQFVEDQKNNACVEELASRLEQQVPANEYQIMRQLLMEDLEHNLEASGMTKEQFAAGLANSPELIDQVVDRQAQSIVEQGAALDAYAKHEKMDVTEDELPLLMGMPKEQANELIAHAKEAGAFDRVKHNALRAKAAQKVFADAQITYNHESEEDAMKRMEHYDNEAPEDFKLV